MLNLLIDRQHIVMMADNSERIMLGLQKIEKVVTVHRKTANVKSCHTKTNISIVKKK